MLIEIPNDILFFDHDALIPVAEEMAGSPMAKVEAHRVSRHESAHEQGERLIATANEKVDVIGEQEPGEEPSPCLPQQLAQSPQKAFPIAIIAEDLPRSIPRQDMVDEA